MKLWKERVKAVAPDIGLLFPTASTVLFQSWVPAFHAQGALLPDTWAISSLSLLLTAGSLRVSLPVRQILM